MCGAGTRQGEGEGLHMVTVTLGWRQWCPQTCASQDEISHLQHVRDYIHTRLPFHILALLKHVTFVTLLF